MKTITSILITVTLLFAALATPSQLAGQQYIGYKLIDLRTLSGTDVGDNALAIALVGPTALPGDHEVRVSLWRNNKMTDLGTVDGDPCSVTNSVNAKGQVADFSAPCDFSPFRAFLSDNESIVDFNELVRSDSPLDLIIPETINDRGEIAGVGLDPSQNHHAFLLIPCSAKNRGCKDASAGPAVRPAPDTTYPADNHNKIRQLRRRLGPPYRIPGPRASSEPSALGSVIGAAAAQPEPANTRDWMPNSLDLTDPISHLGTALSCAEYGRPCSPNGGYPRCCGLLKCVFHGGSTRIGYVCE